MNYSRICLILITICLIIITFTLGLSKSGNVNINKGDNIDFEVGTGPDGNAYDCTPLDVNITKR